LCDATATASASGAACSTEKHPESPDLEHEFRYMKLKVEAGADFLITSSSSTTGSFSTSWRVPGSRHHHPDRARADAIPSRRSLR